MKFQIYKISNNEGKFYIGQTPNELSKVLKQLKRKYMNYLNGNLDDWNCSFQVLGGTDISIECIKDLGEIKLKEAKEQTNTYIDDIDNKSSCVNCVSVIEFDKGTQFKKYTEEIKNNYQQYQKNYYAKNKEYFKNDKYKKKRREYYEKNRDKIIERVKKRYKDKNNLSDVNNE